MPRPRAQYLFNEFLTQDTSIPDAHPVRLEAHRPAAAVRAARRLARVRRLLCGGLRTGHHRTDRRDAVRDELPALQSKLAPSPLPDDAVGDVRRIVGRGGMAHAGPARVVASGAGLGGGQRDCPRFRLARPPRGHAAQFLSGAARVLTMDTPTPSSPLKTPSRRRTGSGLD